ncbi:MAG: hypothetical protein K2O21_00340, partial [Malacoplasma sp.]|nr:hypothetical protein [Malacoplasma sp.]
MNEKEKKLTLNSDELSEESSSNNFEEEKPNNLEISEAKKETYVAESVDEIPSESDGVLDSKEYKNINFDLDKDGLKMFAMAVDISKNFIVNPNSKDIKKENKFDDDLNDFNIKNFQINYSALTNNPINLFYDHISLAINEVVEDFFKIQFNKNNARVKEIDNFTNEIKESELSIIEKKKELKYTKRMWIHFLTIFSFIIIIGLFFIKKFKQNYRVIKEFREFRSKKEMYINKMCNNRFDLMHAAIATFSLSDIYRYCFKRFGFQVNELIPSSEILKILNNRESIDIKLGIGGLYKNSPFYDIVARRLTWRDVVTSASRSFPYRTTEFYTDSKGRTRSRTVTRYETLTGYHSEKTPFIENDNLFLFYTNFEPELSFDAIIDGKNKKNKDFNFENTDFARAYNIQVWGDVKNDLGLGQKVNQFFTIKAQEDYLNWFRKENANKFNFSKIGYLVAVFNNSMNFDSLLNMNTTIDNLGLLENHRNVDFNEIISRVKAQAFSYFQRLTSMMQLPLLTPAINREWYKHNTNRYMIATYDDEGYEDFENSKKIDMSFIMNRFLDYKYLWFCCDKKPKKPIWFQHLNSTVSNSIVHATYMMNSFWSRKLIDPVVVVGVHVGAKVINVPFDRFYFFQEKKHLAFFYFKNKTNVRFVITPNNRNFINPLYYDDLNFGKSMAELGFWINYPDWFENFEFKDKLIEIIKKFNDFNKEGQFTLVLDQYGCYVVSNRYDTKNDFVEKILKEVHN